VWKVGFVLREISICQRGRLKYGTMKIFYKEGVTMANGIVKKFGGQIFV
jgi:hypothetical protein